MTHSDSISCLAPAHLEMLEKESGLPPTVIQTRGYRTVTTKAELKTLGFSEAQRGVPALLLPVHNVQGHIASYQLRPDRPRILKGKPLKYETPSGSRMLLDCHPSARAQLGNPKIPLWITEGIKKGDSLVARGCCAAALLGVWNWRGTNHDGGKIALADWEDVALNNRTVYLVFDSDLMVKWSVHNALSRFAEFLKKREAQVRFVYLPAGESGAKCGVDDYLVQGHSVDDLIGLASSTLKDCPHDDHEEPNTEFYRTTPEGLVYQKPTREGGTVPLRLTNFAATIIADIAEDDGAETCRRFEIEAILHGHRTRFCLPASQFASMNWPTEQLGARAIVYPGMGTRDHARAAIQVLSKGSIEQRVVYCHLGWRQLDEWGWCYFHANGAIGPNGPVPEVTVKVSEGLQCYQLPDPLRGEAMIAAIHASLRILKLGPPRIMTPLFAAVWAPLLGDPAFTIFLAGKTGVFKTELAALAQQFFGAGLNAHHLPGSWLSTANALQGLAFQAKNALFVVDDFSPTGTQTDVQRLHHSADVLLRGQGNRAGRQRMRQDASLRPTKPSRCLILATGEDVPKGESLRARMCILELSEGDIDRGCLSICQKDASEGVFAGVMASFAQWLAKDYEQTRKVFKAHVTALRNQAQSSALHRRTPDTIAHLGRCLRTFFEFVVTAGVLRPTDMEQLWSTCWADLQEAGRVQQAHQAASDPVKRFRELLMGVLTANRAHVVGMEGQQPEKLTTWGWQEFETKPETAVWRPQGNRIGWVDEDAGWLYLEPQASYAAVQRLSQENGEPLSLTARTLRKRLKEAGCLLTESSRSDHVTIRKKIDGQRRDVLAVSLSWLIPEEPDQPDQPDQGTSGSLCGPVRSATVRFRG